MRLDKHTYLVTCEHCDGTGEVEIYYDCGKPASSCCGGCSATGECEECNGSGELYLHCCDLPEDFECADCMNEQTLINHEQTN